jgi:hypothetical protein
MSGKRLWLSAAHALALAVSAATAISLATPATAAEPEEVAKLAGVAHTSGTNDPSVSPLATCTFLHAETLSISHLRRRDPLPGTAGGTEEIAPIPWPL